MIAFLNGVATKIDDERILIKGVESEVGYEVRIPHNHLTPDELLEVVAVPGIYVWHVFRQDDQELFGFWTLADRQLARLIAETDGIGPTTASKVVQSAGWHTVLSAIAQQDAKQLAKLCKGLGPKRAVQIINHLKDYAEDHMQGMTATRIPDHRRKLIERSLVALGFTVNVQDLTKILEDNLELADSQIVRKYIDKVIACM